MSCKWLLLKRVIHKNSACVSYFTFSPTTQEFLSYNSNHSLITINIFSDLLKTLHSSILCRGEGNLKINIIMFFDIHCVPDRKVL
jgi:hypothetical protein